MNFPNEQPPLAAISPTEKLSERKLVKELLAIANNNVRFRRHEIDQVNFSLGEALYCPMATDEVDSGISPDLRRSSVAYNFVAHRVYPGEDSRIIKPFTAFSARAAIEYGPIDMPAHLAQKLLDTDPEEAVDVIGPVTVNKSLELTITTLEPYVRLCDSFAYVDEEDDMIYHGCSCENGGLQDVAYMSDADMYDEDNDNDEIGSSLMAANDPRQAMLQIASFALMERMDQEPIVTNDPEVALRFWASTQTFDYSVEAALYDENLALGFGIVRAIRDGLRRQAGF